MRIEHKPLQDLPALERARVHKLSYMPHSHAQHAQQRAAITSACGASALSLRGTHPVVLSSSQQVTVVCEAADQPKFEYVPQVALGDTNWIMFDNREGGPPENGPT